MLKSFSDPEREWLLFFVWIVMLVSRCVIFCQRKMSLLCESSTWFPVCWTWWSFVASHNTNVSFICHSHHLCRVIYSQFTANYFCSFFPFSIFSLGNFKQITFFSCFLIRKPVRFYIWTFFPLQYPASKAKWEQYGLKVGWKSGSWMGLSTASVVTPPVFAHFGLGGLSVG